MKFNLIYVLKMALTLLCIYLIASCSKDTDLLADYVLSNDDVATMIGEGKVVDDTYSVNLNQSIILDVLNNDNFEAGSNVIIVSTTNPSMGTVEINEDNTLTYTPNSESTEDASESSEESEDNQESSEDSFDYTTEETNEDGTTSTEEGTVTVTNEESKIPTSGENVFFVTITGSGNNNGLSEQTAWSWKHAVSNAVPGMIIYVKAGNYGGGNYTFNQNATAGNEIKFIGYRDSPGDIDAYTQEILGNDTRDRRATTRYADNVEFDYTQSPDFTQMPFFNKNYQKEDIFFRVNGDFIEFHNFIVKGGDFGLFFSNSSTNGKLINSIILEQGRMDVKSTETSHPDRYQGTGLANRGSKKLEVRFSSFLNCEQQALEIRGADSGTYSDNVVYSYNENNGTDYFYLVTGENGTSSKNLIIEYNRCHRLTQTPHGGHGFIVKNGAINNTFRNWKVINTNIEASFANSSGNLFEKGDLVGSYMSSGDNLSYLLTSNGTSGNIFKDIVIDDVWGGLVFLDHGEDKNSSFAGRANDYINIVVKNARYGVIFSESGANLGATNDNRFLNCTFYNTQYGIRAHRNNSGNAFINCHFSASESLYTNHDNYALNTNTKFENCHFSGNLGISSATPFDEKDNMEGNPQFMNPESVVNGQFNVGGLRLLDSSPLINAGKDASQFNSHAAFDFDGNARTTYNIGAF